jgi:hypothetical protein
LDPVGRFAAERLTEDPDGFLSTEDLCASYSLYLHENDHEGAVDTRTLIRRLAELPGVKRVTRYDTDSKRRRGLTGRKLAVTDTRDTRSP